MVECIVEGCPRPKLARELCRMHYYRLRRTGIIGGAAPLTGPESEHVSYHGVHQRLRAQRGHADSYMCFQCGGSAAVWAFSPQDGSTSIEHDDTGVYSIDPDDYQPACVRCHNLLDNIYLRGEEHPCSVLTEAEVNQIAEMLSTTQLSHRKIAAIINDQRTVPITHGPIPSINDGRAWAAVTGATADHPLRPRRQRA